MILDDFRDLMRETVTVETATGIDGYGRTVYGVARSVAAYVPRHLRTVRAFDGSERVSTVQVYLAETIGVTPDDRLTLPSGYVPAQPPLLAVDQIADEDGTKVEVLYT